MRWSELVTRNVERYGELVVGIDPSYSDIPTFLTSNGPADWMAHYVEFVLNILKDQVGFVKFQAAYFEAGGLIGMNALAKGIALAKSYGMAVIIDAKRGDIGSTASAYAQAYLTPRSSGGSGDFESDCLTVNPFLGPETLEPFVDCVRKYNKGLFILCRTSNPGASWLQDRPIGMQTVADHCAQMIEELGRESIDNEGLTSIGAVIGATVAPSIGKNLRQLLPNTIILAPGLGAQGASMEQVNALRGSHRGDLLLPVSRGLLQVKDVEISKRDYEASIFLRLNFFKESTKYTPLR